MNMQSLYSPPRKVPISLKPKLKDELSNLVNNEVITPVTEPTDWCSQMSVQSKKMETYESA